MNIKDFLIENYIWILVVILLSIITIIGFLADKNKSKKNKKVKEDANPANQNQSVDNNLQQSPINFQPQQMSVQPQNALGIEQGPNSFSGITNTTINPINTNIQEGQNPQMNTVPQPMPNQNMNLYKQQAEMLNPQVQNNEELNQQVANVRPVENISMNNNVNPEPMYQPLSEQKPNIPPRNVMPTLVPNQEFNMSNNQMNFGTTEPTMNAIPQSQPVQMPTLNVIPNTVPTNNNPNSMNNVNMDMNMGMNMNNNQMPQNNTWMNNQQAQTPNMNNGQQMMNNQRVMGMPSQPQMPMGEQSTIPNPVTPPQPVNPSPINFVYGANQNNNQNM